LFDGRVISEVRGDRVGKGKLFGLASSYLLSPPMKGRRKEVPKWNGR
jgi:hypothetical protein